MEPILTLKIGIVLNYKNAEKKKDELMNINSFKMPWLSRANESEYKKHVILRKGKKHVPADVAIGLYLESLNVGSGIGISIDYITPDEISTRRFKENDIVFVVIYDLLESFHLSDKTKFYKYKTALMESDNVYPPYEYQKFINNKCKYYSYLGNKGIPVAPTHCITKEKWFKRDADRYVNKIINKIKNNKWESVIAKPVYGQESKDFAKFMAKANCNNNNRNNQCKMSLDNQREHFKRYLSKNIPKYKSIVLQEYIPGFDKNNPEIRTYFLNGQYVYSIITTSHLVECPTQEGGRYPIPSKQWKYLMKFSKRVMETLPKLDLPGDLKNPILTRIDIGSGLEGVPYTYFVNEVEFVPSLYIEDQNYPVVQEIAKSLLRVAMEYRFTKGKIEVKF
jgi:hypothetical protein